MSKSNVVICNYNDYFSRKINDKLTFDGYCGLEGAIYDAKEYNFVPNNGVSTEFVYNYNLNEVDDNILPNYFVERHISDGIEILTRWFILDSYRTRNGQYKLSLKRDVVSDFYSTFKNDKFYIQRANASIDNPLIFNQEGIKVNEILTSRTELKDATGVSWIIGFVAPHEDGQTWDTNRITGQVKNNSSAKEYTSVDALKADLFSSKKVLTKVQVKIDLGYLGDLTQKTNYTSVYIILNKKNVSYKIQNEGAMDNYFMRRNSEANVYTKNNDEIIEAALTTIGTDGYMKYADYENIVSTYNGKAVSINGTKYKPEYTVSDTSTKETIDVSSNDNLFLVIRNIVEDKIVGNKNKIVDVTYYYNDIDVNLGSSIEKDTSPYIETIANRPHLNDAPYDMFAIPYKDELGAGMYYSFDYNGKIVTRLTSPQKSMAIANAIARVGQSAVYDIQIVPYCPILDDMALADPTTINTTLLTDYNYILQENMKIPMGVVIWCNSSSFKTVINKKIEWEDNKLSSICDKYRLCSNNYNGAYEFNPMANGTSGVERFYVNGTYLPYQSWVRIRPEFSYLNGLPASEKDSRGLILQGNFSITRVNDTWQQYQLNNINYEAIFNRGIKNAKINQKWNQIQNGIGAIGGGAGTGVAAGVALANPIAGVALGATSALAGIGDMAINQQLFKESISYQKDVYEMNIGNIQAQPDTLSKVTAINVDTRQFPFIEYYTCTDEEKEYVKNKLETEGMTIGITDNLANWITTDTSFVKATMITSDDSTTSTQIKVAFSEEFAKGLYMKELD